MADRANSDLYRLALDLGTVPGNSGRNLIVAFNVTSGKIRKTWQGKLRGSAYLPGLPQALSWDVTASGTTLESEIGFDKSRGQGALGNVSEFGTPRSPGRGFGLASLEENESDFEKGIEIAIDQALKEAGL